MINRLWMKITGKWDFMGPVTDCRNIVTFTRSKNGIGVYGTYDCFSGYMYLSSRCLLCLLKQSGSVGWSCVSWWMCCDLRIGYMWVVDQGCCLMTKGGIFQEISDVGWGQDFGSYKVIHDFSMFRKFLGVLVYLCGWQRDTCWPKHVTKYIDIGDTEFFCNFDLYEAMMEKHLLGYPLYFIQPSFSTYTLSITTFM